MEPILTPAGRTENQLKQDIDIQFSWGKLGHMGAVVPIALG